MNNLKSLMCAIAVASAFVSIAQARDVNVQKLKLEKTLERAYAKMQEDGNTPCAEFMELYNGIKDGNYVFDHTLLCAAVADIDTGAYQHQMPEVSFALSQDAVEKIQEFTNN